MRHDLNQPASTKHGAVHAQIINAFYQTVFNPWLNGHRPCLFATEITSPKGKIVKRYRHADVKTPLACLAQLSAQVLVRFKAGVTLHALQAQADAQSDLAAAQAMQQAKAALFAQCNTAAPRRRA